jgi:hypothetical protein
MDIDSRSEYKNEIILKTKYRIETYKLNQSFHFSNILGRNKNSKVYISIRLTNRLICSFVIWIKVDELHKKTFTDA